MWSVIAGIVARLAMVRWLFKVLGGLGLLVPFAFLLKLIGLPILAVVSVLALPVLLVLFVFGLPIFLVLLVGGAVMGLVFSALSAGLMVLKVVLIVGLPVWLFWRLAHWMWGDRGRNGAAPGDGAVD